MCSDFLYNPHLKLLSTKEETSNIQIYTCLYITYVLFLSNFNKTLILSIHILLRPQNKLLKNPQQEPHCSTRKDGQPKDTMTLISTFWNVSKIYVT